MGAFFLVNQQQGEGRDIQCANLAEQFRLQGFVDPKIFTTPHLSLYVYSKLSTSVINYLEMSDGDFCASTGTFFYKNKIGVEAMKLFHDEFPVHHISDADIRGEFCLIVSKAGTTYLMIDDIGIYKVYRTSDGLVWSSSFLVAVAGCKNLSIDRQACYEFVFTGGIYGGNTLISDVTLIAGRTLYSLSGNSQDIERKWFIPVGSKSLSFAESVEKCLSELGPYFDAIVDNFGQQISTGLSGGYDSRLLVAMLLERNVLPELHVYGPDSDEDVLIAKLINEGEDLGLSHFDRDKRDPVSLDRFPDVVSKNYHWFDGIPYAGILKDTSEYESRFARAASGRMYLNGGAGEIFRNFFFILNHPFTLSQFTTILFGKFDPVWCVNTFSEKEYLNTLREKIRTTLGFEKRWISRTQIEAAYVGIRSRFWMTRNNALDHRFGHSLTPFIDPRVVDTMVDIPIRFKNFGKLQSAMIHQVSPALAKYTSVYGHSFDKPPPVKLLINDLLIYVRPSTARKYAFRARSRRQSLDRPYTLSEPYLKATIPKGFQLTQRLFRPENLSDSLKFNRLATLEYFFQKVGASYSD